MAFVWIKCWNAVHRTRRDFDQKLMFDEFTWCYSKGRNMLSPTEVLQKPFCSEFPWSFVCASIDSSPSAKCVYSVLWINKEKNASLERDHGQLISFIPWNVTDMLWEQPTSNNNSLKLCHASLLCSTSLELSVPQHAKFSFYLGLSAT